VSEAEIENEIEVMEKFRTSTHEHIIEILRHGDIGTKHYFIDMEYCDIDLDQYIRGVIQIDSLMGYQKAITDGYLSFYICAILQQLISGLVFIHRKHRTVHRDLKPKNSKTYSLPADQS